MAAEVDRLPRVLAVDDDADILRVVRMAFEVSAWEVATASSGAEALAWIGRRGLPDLGVFDLNMPGMSGLELCERLHAFCDLPVLFLTVVDDEETVVNTIDRFAEDYVSKPFRPREVVARARRILRRVGVAPPSSGADTRIDGRLTICFGRQVALIGETEVALTPTETKILHILVRAAPKVVGTEQFLRRVWADAEVFEDTLRVHLHRLRQKVEVDPSRPEYILTHRGYGYAFHTPGQSAEGGG
jgi:DNA-binding response OmpR family regulator